jgi:RimJ/RimL family protein N-acetyltransferase
MKIFAPPLETKNLRLRQHGEQDLSAYVALRAHPDVFRYTTGSPMTEEVAWQRITSSLGHWALKGYGLWAIEEKKTGEFIGSMGFIDSRRKYVASRHGIPEAGWWLAADKQGRGYATEAVDAIHDWGDVHLNAKYTFCGIITENQASLRLAEGIGYRVSEEATYLEKACFVLERPCQASRAADVERGDKIID